MILVIFAAFTMQAAAPGVLVRVVDGQARVDAVVATIDPMEFAGNLAAGTNRTLVGGDLLTGRGTLELNIVDRPLEDVLELLAHAMHTRVEMDRHAITFTNENPFADSEELQMDAESAWVSLVRDYPDREAARTARVWLGIAQERRGHDVAALAHYEAAAREAMHSPAAERALRAAGAILTRRGEWTAALDRFSRLAQSSPERDVQVEARLGVARALAEQGRGAEALALVDVVDLSYPAQNKEEVADRHLARARAHLASGSATEALHDLDARAAADPRLGERLEDLELRARTLEQLGSPLESARAWLACSASDDAADRAFALESAARLSAVGGDDLAILFIERVARGGTSEVAVTRLADAARIRLGIDSPEKDIGSLEQRWNDRSGLSGRERAALAADLVTETARERGADEAAIVARNAIGTVSIADGRTIRSALAVAYENEGAWAEAARVWGGTAP